MTDSEIVESIPLRLQGVWIHDPSNPESTVKRFPYSEPTDRGVSIGIDSVGQHYAGRVYPVFDVSSHETRAMSVQLELIRNDPYFPASGTLQDLQNFQQSRRDVVIRDGKGRVVQGLLNGLVEVGVHYGFIATFNVSQSDVEVVTP